MGLGAEAKDNTALQQVLSRVEKARQPIAALPSYCLKSELANVGSFILY